MRGRLLTVIVAGFLIGALGGAAALILTRGAAGPRVATTGTALIGGPFTLIGHDGKPVTDQAFRGKYMLVFFGYTYCPDVCPTTLAVESEALGKLGARADRVVPIFITVDPKRDTPQKLKPYLASFGPSFVGLTGSDAEIAKAAQGYRVYYQAHIDGRTQSPEGYSVDHTGNIYLMGPDGRFVSYYSPGILPDELAADLMRKVSSG